MACAVQPEKLLKLLHESFPGYVISRFDIQNWPPMPCDLTSLDFFLLVSLKSKAYGNKLTITLSLKEETEHCIKEFHSHLCKMVMEIFNQRVRICQQSH